MSTRGIKGTARRVERILNVTNFDVRISRRLVVIWCGEEVEKEKEEEGGGSIREIPLKDR